MNNSKLMTIEVYQEETYIENHCCKDCSKIPTIQAIEALLEYLKNFDKQLTRKEITTIYSQLWKLNK